jgi:hypothetical protein
MWFVTGVWYLSRGKCCFFTFSKRPDCLWWQPSLLYDGHKVSIPGVTRPVCEINHPPPSSAEIKKGWSYTSTVYTRLQDVCSGNFAFLLYVTVYYCVLLYVTVHRGVKKTLPMNWDCHGSFGLWRRVVRRTCTNIPMECGTFLICGFFWGYYAV